MRILGISGSLRRESWNSKLLRTAGELLPHFVEFEVWDELKAVPPFDEDDEHGPAPAAVASLREAVARADAIVFATPEYNASIPGQLKNAIDWLSRPTASTPLRNKPVVVVGASLSAFGAVWSQAELQKVHADEFHTDADLVRRLLEAQFPEWAALPLERVSSSGTDNALYRLDDK